MAMKSSHAVLFVAERLYVAARVHAFVFGGTAETRRSSVRWVSSVEGGAVEFRILVLEGVGKGVRNPVEFLKEGFMTGLYQPEGCAARLYREVSALVILKQ